MSLLSELVPPDDSAKTRDYYDMLNSHVGFLKNHATTERRSVTPLQAAIFRGDFYGLLHSVGIDKKYHYLIMRVNGLDASNQFDGLNTELLLPSLGLIESIIVLYNSKEDI